MNQSVIERLTVRLTNGRICSQHVQNIEDIWNETRIDVSSQLKETDIYSCDREKNCEDEFAINMLDVIKTRPSYQAGIQIIRIQVIIKKDAKHRLQGYFITFGSVLTYLINQIQNQNFQPDDPANPCANYPTEEFDSYADGDDHFVRRTLPAGLKPFWTVDNISEATETFTMNEEYSR